VARITIRTSWRDALVMEAGARSNARPAGQALAVWGIYHSSDSPVTIWLPKSPFPQERIP